MTDQRVENFARILVDYSTQVNLVPTNGLQAVVIPVNVRVTGHIYPLYLPVYH